MKDDQLWVWFSRYIRLRDSDENGIVQCFTCLKKQVWNSGGMQAGHFIVRKHTATKYHEFNCHSQCVECNQYLGGRQYEHGVRIDQVHGEGTALELLALSRSLMKMTDSEIKELTAKYRIKARELAKEKGFTV